MKVSLIIPIYNESLHLKEFLKKIDSFDLGCEKELVIIDDCSTDGSDQIIAEHEFVSAYQFHKQSQNQGKGAAIRLGIKAATGEIIGIQDADFEYQLSDIPKVLQPLR
jgi:glycosyltransferase involved in cell wall biosynthesis